MNQEQSTQDWTRGNNEMALQQIYFHKCMLAYYFGDLELAGKMSAKMWSSYVEGPDVWVPYRFFFQGLTAISLANNTKLERYRRQGNRIIRRMEQWVQNGVVNCHHMLKLLRAEQLAGSSKAKTDAVGRAFDNAISAAGRLGFLHNQALANERAGIYFLGKQERTRAATYLVRARALYDEWGARAKVEHISFKFRDVLDTSSERTRVSGSVKAKQRLSTISKDVFKPLRMSVSDLE